MDISNRSLPDPHQVSADTFCKAAELIEYFECNALKVFKLMEKFRDPLNGYAMDIKLFTISYLIHLPQVQSGKSLKKR